MPKTSPAVQANSNTIPYECLPMPSSDAAAFFKCSSDAFGQIAAVARVIEERAEKHSDMRSLAGVIAYLANDMENVVGCWGDHAERCGVAK